MSDMSALSISPALLSQPQAMTGAELSKRKDIAATAQSFESSFLSIMMQQMFEGVDVSAPFGGGSGEAMFKSFMTDAIAKEVTKAGGVGVTDVVAKEMLKLQGLE